MSNEQKLREAFSRIRARLMLDVIDSHTISLVIADCDQALATTEPAVNQQLTTEPVDERAAFEQVIVEVGGGGAVARWPNEKGASYENARVQDYRQGWLWCLEWQARAAMAQVSDINVVESFTNDTKDAERYRCIRRGQHVSVINGIGDMLRAENLDAAIDAAMAKGVKG